MTLEPEVAETYLLPQAASLDDVTSIRLEVVELSGAKSTNLDVDILGCVKG